MSSIAAADLSRLIADEGVQVLDAGEAALWRWDPAAGSLVLNGEEGQAVAVPPAHRSLLTRLSTGLEDETETRVRLMAASFGEGRAGHAAMSVPLVSGTDPIGVLLLLDAVCGGDVAESFAHQAAAVLANHEVLAAARRSEAQLAALYETAHELSSKLDLDTVLTAIVERSKTLLGTPISYIMLVDEAAGEIYMRVTSGVAHPGFAELRLEVGEGLGGRVADRRLPLGSSDYLNDRAISHHAEVDSEVRAEGIRSILGVPLSASEHFLGVLYVADRRVRSFDPAQTAVLTSLANHAALAIENSMLYEQATTALAELERTTAVASVQYERLQRAEQLNDALSKALLAGRGLAEVVELMATFVGQRVFVVDDRQRILAAAGTPSDRFGELVIEHGVEAALAKDAGSSRAKTMVNRLEATVIPAGGPDRRIARLVVPIVSRAEVMGALWAEVPPERLEEDRALIEQGARVVALDLLMEKAVAETERRLGSEFLSELFAARGHLHGGLQRRAVELGIDLDECYRLVVLHASAAMAADVRVAARARERIVKRLRQQPWCPFVAEWNGRTIALVQPSVANAREKLEELLASTTGDEAGFRAILSPPCSDMADYRREYVACDRVMQLLTPSAGRLVTDLAESRVLGLLFREGGEAELRGFVEAQLGPLASEREHGPDLIRTLEVYLASGGSPSRTAESLHVHVNTVYYRLAKIRELVGDQLDDPRQALNLQVAVLARRLTMDDGSATA